MSRTGDAGPPGGGPRPDRMVTEEQRRAVRALAERHIAGGDPLGWFEELYRRAAGDASGIPWADRGPNPNLTGWDGRNEIRWDSTRALVVGCGLGDDAEFLSGLGAKTTAFDISPACIEWCRRRHDGTNVRYEIINLLDPPARLNGGFDFVLESYTLQALPEPLRPRAIERIAGFLSAGGRLLVICRGREDDEPAGQLPWPLTRRDLSLFEAAGLERTAFDDYEDGDGGSPVRRFRAVYRRPAAPAAPVPPRSGPVADGS